MAADFQPLFRIVCDLETSGGDPIRNGIIAACFLVIDESDNVIDKFIRYVRPADHTRKLWSLEAQGVHGISFEQVSGFMPNDQFCYELLCFLAPYRGLFPREFICHANPKGWYDHQKHDWKIWPWFDYNFLEWSFRKAFFGNGSEMVWSMYKVIHPDYLISTVKMGKDAGYTKNSLNVWAERLGFKLNHHEMESDSYCCLETYKFLKAKHGQENYFGT